MPPAVLLLLALAGMALSARRKRVGAPLALVSLLGLWLLSCHGAAVLLASTVLPQYPAATSNRLAADKVQAIVILGGGVLPVAPEYSQAQLNASSLSRLRYGIWLSRQVAAGRSLPIAFSGGLGWAASDQQTESEAEVAARTALEGSGVTLRWQEGTSRDTAENASQTVALLKRDGIKQIALVTHAWHMPRALPAFERAGIGVTPAPMGFVLPQHSLLLEWLPSAEGLLASQQVLREWLGLRIAQLHGA